MKNVITFLMCSLCIIAGIAQSDLSGNAIVIPERTPELEALYQQAKTLEENGTAAEINANRIAIKNAWQDIDPNTAALYKPIETMQYSQVGGDGNFRPTTIVERPEQSRSPEDWDTDRLLRDDYIDGLDMDVTGSGDIYITAFENFTGSGSDSNLYIYRSTDGGNTFTLWIDLPVINSFFSKIQTISMDGSGDDYLLVYSMFENGVFQALRWNVASAAFAFQTVASNVTDFGVDRNYPGNTSAQRVFATYQKTTSCTAVHSARSTAGSYGFDWVDEVSLGTCGQQLEFTYGLNGASYATYTGATSGNLYAEVNSNYNDPASWGTRETVIDGSVTEVLNPTIRAARLELATDKVVIWASQRAAGS
ncbi:MAG TPA: T9SS C-terminal target domain-containing protein, partial [Aequorivita sp.]|nr:T9SS C-terminal target domain-containing protein [Aequorivita sp.]